MKNKFEVIKGCDSDQPHQISEEEIKKLVQEGKTAQEILGYSDQQIEMFYQFGLELFDSKRFQDSSDVFFLLALISPFYDNIWIALALSEQNNQNVEGALSAYQMAIATNPSNPTPYLNAAKLAVEIKELDQAQGFLELMQELVERDEKTELAFQESDAIKAELK